MNDGVPHTSDGYIRIANELHAAIARSSFTARERRIIDAIIAKTYGFNKPRDRISQSQIAEYTKIHQANVSQILTKLVKKKVILSTGKYHAPVLEVNKLYKQWCTEIHIDGDIHIDTKKSANRHTFENANISTVISKSISTVISKSISPSIYTRDTRHKTIHQSKHLLVFEKRKSLRFFEIFWRIYPKKVSKKAAAKKWLKINPNKNTARMIILKVLETKEKKWNLSESRFIPHAATWLNGERWRDEIEDERNKPTTNQDGNRTRHEQTRDRLDQIARDDIEQNWNTEGNRG